jgi:hypothetical protein
MPPEMLPFYPAINIVRARRVLPTRDDRRLDALAAMAGDALQVEDGNRPSGSP